MANDTRSIGEKLRAMEERAAESMNNPANRPESEKPAEGSRENAGGAGNRPRSEEPDRRENVPPRGKSKGGGHAQ